MKIYELLILAGSRGLPPPPSSGHGDQTSQAPLPLGSCMFHPCSILLLTMTRRLKHPGDDVRPVRMFQLLQVSVGVSVVVWVALPCSGSLPIESGAGKPCLMSQHALLPGYCVPFNLFSLWLPPARGGDCGNSQEV